jgi:hypothetical protein
LVEGARLESGYMRKRIEGSNPSLSAIKSIIQRISFGRARRGGSGALYLQPAIAGSNSHLRL